MEVIAALLSVFLAPTIVVGKTSATVEVRLTGHLVESWSVDFRDDGTATAHGTGDCFDVVRTAEFVEVTPC